MTEKEYNIYMKYVLIKSRHIHNDIDNIPAIFEDSIQPAQIFDFDYHKKIIHSKLNNKDTLTLYVTGLTPLLISVLNYCKLFGIAVLLYHYDTDGKCYRPQSVI